MGRSIGWTELDVPQKSCTRKVLGMACGALARGCWHFLAILGVISALSFSAGAKEEDITVNVSTYVRKTPSNPKGLFRGFGINIVGHQEGNGYNWYSSAPQKLRDKWVKKFWVDLDMRVMRLWCGDGMGIKNSHTADEMYAMYHEYIDDVKKQQKNRIIMIFDPHSGWSHTDPAHSWSLQMTDDKLRAYVVKHADVMKELYDKYKWRMDYVEITNEPEVYGKEGGWSNPKLWSKALIMTKMWREELDKRGFKDVKILAPSRCMVNIGDALPMIDAIKEDKKALKAWAGYSFHSYGSGMLKVVMDRLEGLDVDIVQTESGGIPRLRGISLAISDINLGTTHWLHFQGYGFDRNGGSLDGKGGENTVDFNGIRFAGVINEGKPDMDVRPFAKFYFLRELAKTVTVDSRVHLCSTDRKDKERYTYMENTHGEQTPINATAAEQKDGRWGLIVFNNSSDVGLPGDEGYKPYPATTFNVKFVVERLKNQPSSVFKVRKLKPDGSEHDLPDQTMKNGEITITGLLPNEMVSLRSVKPLTAPLK